MKTIRPEFNAAQQRAFTLPELVMTLGIFCLMLFGLFAIHLFGVRQSQFIQSKLGASDHSRHSLHLLVNEIRRAKQVKVGFGTQNSFTEIDDGQLQRGSALQIYPTTNDVDFIRYYLDANACELRRVESGAADYQMVAQYLTNTLIFQAEDYTGTNVLTVGTEDVNYNYTIATKLEFFQYQYPVTQVGPDKYYNYYKMQFKATRRSP
jgi:prepilin-type N-terminal cleavage/methylation domain-containing protein